MKTLSIDSMTYCQGGKKLSTECIDALVAEGISYGSLFFAATVASAGVAIAGLIVSAVIMGLACSE